MMENKMKENVAKIRLRQIERTKNTETYGKKVKRKFSATNTKATD